MKLLIKLLRYVHAAFMFIMIVPLFYAVGEVSVPDKTLIIFLKCMLVIIPLIITDKAIVSCKSLVSYGLIAVALIFGMYGITGVLPKLIYGRTSLEVYEFCYCVVLVAETFIIGVIRLSDRLKKVDFLEGKEPSIIDSPKVHYMWYFVVMYLIGILFNSKIMCDISFYVAIAYMFTAMLYGYITGTNYYLMLNNRIRGIPKKRLYGVSFAMLLIFFMILAVGILPSVFLAGYRHYTDIRTWFDDVETVPYEYESEGGFNEPLQQGAEMMIFMDDTGQAGEPSELVNVFFWIIGCVCILVFVYAVVKTIKQIFKDFRNTLDENGDLIEEIEDDEASYKEDFVRIRKGGEEDSEAWKIRRRYKKTIKKHRKDLPAPYESPVEIEENAGLKEDEEMKSLHGMYEAVRYGKN
jgi:hypothetical protein